MTTKAEIQVLALDASGKLYTSTPDGNYSRGSDGQYRRVVRLDLLEAEGNYVLSPGPVGPPGPQGEAGPDREVAQGQVLGRSDSGTGPTTGVPCTGGIVLDGSGLHLASTVDRSGGRITGLPAPAAPSDAVTLSYLESALGVGGLPSLLTAIAGSLTVTGAVSSSGYTGDWSVDILDPGETTTVYQVSIDYAGTISGLNWNTQTGRVIALVNAPSSTAAVTLFSEDETVGAAYRFALGGVNVVLQPGDAALLWYDGTASRWIALSKPTPAPEEAGDGALDLTNSLLPEGQAIFDAAPAAGAVTNFVLDFVLLSTGGAVNAAARREVTAIVVAGNATVLSTREIYTHSDISVAISAMGDSVRATVASGSSSSQDCRIRVTRTEQSLG